MRRLGPVRFFSAGTRSDRWIGLEARWCSRALLSPPESTPALGDETSWAQPSRDHTARYLLPVNQDVGPARRRIARVLLGEIGSRGRTVHPIDVPRPIHRNKHHASSR